MSKQLRIYKVNSKPLVFQPSSLYLVKDGSSGLLYMYLSDSTGTVIYRSHEGTDIANVVNAILNMSKGQPNGLAVLDGDSLIPVINLPSNSPTATKLATARLINLISDVVGSASFDGSSDVNITATLANSGVTAGTYKSVTVNVKGLVTGGTNPTTLAGYGITDAIPLSDKGAANGVAPLGADSKVPLANLPTLTAASADKLTTPRTITISGDANGSASFDGSANVSISIEVVDDSHNHTFANLLIKPTTIDEYGITDAISTSMIGQPNGVAGVNSSGQVVIDGQNIDLTGGGGIWDTQATFITTKNTTGGNNPTYGTVFGNFQGYIFASSTTNQFWVDYTIKHGVTLNSKVYPFIHFMPLTNNSGVVRWAFEYTIAKGYGQQAFSTTSVTIYVDHVIPANSRYVHMTAEVPDASAILSANIEPNSTIKMRVYRNGSHANDTYNFDVHAWEAGLHYQVARFGTKNRLPPFFS